MPMRISYIDLYVFWSASRISNPVSDLTNPWSLEVVSVNSSASSPSSSRSVFDPRIRADNRFYLHWSQHNVSVINFIYVLIKNVPYCHTPNMEHK